MRALRALRNSLHRRWLAYAQFRRWLLVLYAAWALVSYPVPGCLLERFLFLSGHCFLFWLPVFLPARWHLGIQMCLS